MSHHVSFGGAQRRAEHKISTSQWLRRVRVTPAPFVKPPLPQLCILVIIIISTLTVSIMGIMTRMALAFVKGYIGLKAWALRIQVPDDEVPGSNCSTGLG